MRRIDLNSDIEQVEVPDELLNLITSMNIPCGGHTGDEGTMRKWCEESLRRDLQIGAHVSYPDRAGFGRKTIETTETELLDSIRRQLAALIEAARWAGTTVSYVKPHGALYNDGVRGEEPARAALIALSHETGLPLMILEGSTLAAGNPIPIIKEGFIDRAYLSDGSLAPRSDPGALVTDPAVAARQALQLAPQVDSLCVHSDTPGALRLLSAAREALIDAGYEIHA